MYGRTNRYTPTKPEEKRRLWRLEAKDPKPWLAEIGKDSLVNLKPYMACFVEIFKNYANGGK